MPIIPEVRAFCPICSNVYRLGYDPTGEPVFCEDCKSGLEAGMQHWAKIAQGYSDALFRYLGIDAGYHDAGFSYYTVETHICHLREVAAEEPLYVTTQIVAADDKRIHLFHAMHHGRDDTTLATAEQMLLHVDTREGRACAARADAGRQIHQS